MGAVREIQRRHGIVGRDEELAMALAVLGTGRHLLLEGPVGVGKTTVALAVCDHLGRQAIRVDGDDRYSEAKLTGWFDPPLVLQEGFGEASFSAGPLVEAMRAGAVLFINELNRMPETVQNVLLPALDEGRIGVPHLGEVRARDGFQVVATQNPVEYVATGHLSEALRDRFEHLALSYQPAAEEVAIVAAETGSADRTLVAAAVRMARATRGHPAVRKGASVRAAIATVQVAERLAAVSGTTRPSDPALLRRAAAAAFRTRIDLREDAAGGRGFEALLDELVGAAADGDPPADRRDADEPGTGDAEVPGTPGGPGVRDDADPDAPAVLVVDRTSAGGGGARRVPPDGWAIAAQLTSGRAAHLDADARAVAERLAVAEVLRRATRLVGPVRGRTRVTRAPARSAHDGELDVATTLEQLAGKRHPDGDDWIVERREERRRQVVLAVDTSGSMASEAMALAAVAAAVLALKVRPGDLGIVGFADEARDVLVLGERPPVQAVLARLLGTPCRGATNLRAALEAVERQLGHSRDPRRAAVLLTDGQYTAGADPRPLAARFGTLHVLHTLPARPATTAWIHPGRQAGEDLARLGHGRLVPVSTFAELPRRMLDLASAVLRT